MERAVVLIHSGQREKLIDLAHQAGVSVAEIHRRAIDAYHPEDVEKNELLQLAEAVIQSNAHTMRVLKAARDEIKKTLADLKGEAHHDA